MTFVTSVGAVGINDAVIAALVGAVTTRIPPPVNAAHAAAEHHPVHVGVKRRLEIELFRGAAMSACDHALTPASAQSSGRIGLPSGRIHVNQPGLTRSQSPMRP